MVRHGNKTPDNHITADCLLGIVHHGIFGIGNGVNRIQLGSSCVRTAETVMAFATWLTMNNGRLSGPIIPSDLRLGSDELFSPAKMITPSFIANVKAGMSNFVALKESADRRDFSNWASIMRSALYNVFDQLNEGDICFSATHSPTIEMLANSFGIDGSTLNFKELRGVTFTQEDNGTIDVEIIPDHNSAE